MVGFQIIICILFLISSYIWQNSTRICIGLLLSVERGVGVTRGDAYLELNNFGHV
jgi:hypothetical protein